MLWWSLSFIIVAYIIHTLWKTWVHPAQVLARQAANMNWKISGREKDDEGYWNVSVARDGMEAIILYQDGRVALIEPFWPAPFKDFIEIEHWIVNYK